MSRSTRCPAPNTPRMTTHLAPCRLSLLDLRVLDVHSTHPARDHRCPLTPPLPSAPSLSTPPWSRPHLCLTAAQLHSHAPPRRHPKKRPVSGPRAPQKPFHPPSRTATGLGQTQLTRAPLLELFHLPLSRQRSHTERELPQRTLPDTLTPHRSALTACPPPPGFAFSVVYQSYQFTMSDARFFISSRVQYQTRLLHLIHTLTPCHTRKWKTTLVLLWRNTNRKYPDLLFTSLQHRPSVAAMVNLWHRTICFFYSRYKAVYNYKPQNSDELELREGDIVQVMEKCDDGWFVGKKGRDLSLRIKSSLYVITEKTNAISKISFKKCICYYKEICTWNKMFAH